MPSDEINRELGALVLQHFPTRVNLTAAGPHRARGPPAAGGVRVRRPRRPGPAACRWASPGAWSRSCRAGSTRRWPPAGSRSGAARWSSCTSTRCRIWPTRRSERRATLVDRLVRHQFSARLWLVPFGEIQREVVLGVPAPLRVVVYRRLMARIAEAIARKTGALALVTGESLGQVASQTLENIARTTEVVGMPVLRPLIGTDKEEIIREARAIGTYEISIEPDQDCCTLFVPKHPETRATAEAVAEAEARLDIARLVETGTARAASETFRFPPVEAERARQRRVVSPSTATSRSAAPTAAHRTEPVAEEQDARGAWPSGAPPGSARRTRSPASSGARSRRARTQERSAPRRGRRGAPTRARRPPATPRGARAGG